jgi:hypothetical protein
LADYFSPPSGAGTDHAISCECNKCEWADDLREAAHALLDAADARAVPIAFTPSAARELIAAWGGDEDEDNRIIVQRREAWTDTEDEQHPTGLYLHFEECPEEGVIGPIDIPSAAPSAQQEPEK